LLFFPNLSSHIFLLVFYRVFRANPNPNPNFRVPEMSGIDFSKQISGSIFENPNFRKPEIPDPNFSGNPNAQPYPHPAIS